MLARFNEWRFRPQSIRVDNGPQFRTEFEEFCRSHSIQYVTSSPYHSQGNGHAEAAVKNVKHLLSKCQGKFNEDFHNRLCEWTNTPRHDGFSPAQLLFGRRQKGALPVLPQAYEPINTHEAELKRRRKQDDNKVRADKHASPIKDITPGTPVVIQDTKSLRWDTTGVVVATYQNGRCLKIRLDNSQRLYFRNRRHVRPT